MTHIKDTDSYVSYIIPVVLVNKFVWYIKECVLELLPACRNYN